MPILFAQSEFAQQTSKAPHMRENTPSDRLSIQTTTEQQPNSTSITFTTEENRKGGKNLNDNEWKMAQAFFPTWA